MFEGIKIAIKLELITDSVPKILTNVRQSKRTVVSLAKMTF